MGLAGHHHLEGVPGGNKPQSGQIVKQQIRALIAGHPPGKTQQGPLWVQFHPTALCHPLDQFPLGQAMGLPDRLAGDLIGPDQQLRFQTPAGSVVMIELGEGWMGPGARVDAVGDGVDSIARKLAAGDFRMAFGHSVDILA